MLIYRGGKKRDFLQLHEEAIEQCHDIIASIPYSILDDACEDFFNRINSANVTAKIYFRIDWSIPFDPRIINKFSNEKISFKGVVDNLHAKVIWWKKWGFYIGSSNLTNRSCFINHEAGLFFYEQDAKKEIPDELDKFFLELEDDSIICDDELVEKLNIQHMKLDGFRNERALLSSNFMTSSDISYIK
ncbi:phospholipase D-like domain-containing protein [Aeromonas dhakensis]|uniref:phospholipase D-like domain-containing protein n=1 Tax=Aeromonas dhakensis TaxID=196024 RepID=UPI003987C32C